MEYSPPPLFKQGASARAKVGVFALLAIALLIADSQFNVLKLLRQSVATVLYPIQMIALMPRDSASQIGNYFSSLSMLTQQNQEMRREQIANAQILQQAQQLSAENNQLRKLLGTSQQMPLRTVMGEILYDARDAFTRKIVLDRGSRQGVAAGQPVIDEVGVVGQVTRVFPFTSEVTLLTDRDQAIPVQVVRSGLRSVAYGRGQSGVLDLRFMAANADIKPGDLLVTSGIDGVYPPGLAVATVVLVESKSSDSFAHIVCQPAAGVDRNRQLLILLADANKPERAAALEPKQKKEKFSRKRGLDNSRDAEGDTGKNKVANPSPARAGNSATAPGASPAAGAAVTGNNSAQSNSASQNSVPPNSLPSDARPTPPRAPIQPAPAQNPVPTEPTISIQPAVPPPSTPAR